MTCKTICKKKNGTNASTKTELIETIRVIMMVTTLNDDSFKIRQLILTSVVFFSFDMKCVREAGQALR